MTSSDNASLIEFIENWLSLRSDSAMDVNGVAGRVCHSFPRSQWDALLATLHSGATVGRLYLNGNILHLNVAVTSAAGAAPPVPAPANHSSRPEKARVNSGDKQALLQSAVQFAESLVLKQGGSVPVALLVRELESEKWIAATVRKRLVRQLRKGVRLRRLFLADDVVHVSDGNPTEDELVLYIENMLDVKKWRKKGPMMHLVRTMVTTPLSPFSADVVRRVFARLRTLEQVGFLQASAAGSGYKREVRLLSSQDGVERVAVDWTQTAPALDAPLVHYFPPTSTIPMSSLGDDIVENATTAATSAGATCASALPPLILVQSLQSCAIAAGVLLSASHVAVDCEGDLEMARPDAPPLYLRLVQVAVVGTVFLFDMQFPAGDGSDDDNDAAATRNAIDDCVRRMLLSPSVVKVFHDCRLDIAAICKHVGIDASAVVALYDTQVAYEMACAHHLVPRLHRGPRASLNDVLRAFSLPTNARKDLFHAAFDADAKFWHRATLSADQLEYAADDVRWLLHARAALLSAQRAGIGRLSLLHSQWYQVIEPTSVSDAPPIGIALCLSFDSASPASQVVATRLGDHEAIPPPAMPPVSLEQRLAYAAELSAFMRALPPSVRTALQARVDAALVDQLVEVIVDIGERARLLLRDGTMLELADCVVSAGELQRTIDEEWRAQRIVLGPDQRAALAGTLHRISVKRDRLGLPDGLTCRVGRHVPGAAAALRDVVARVVRDGASLLLLGPPGSGKTTLLRECTSLLAAAKKNTHIVDTSNEIAGDGSPKHPAVGGARRSSVPPGTTQADVMREVVANHTPAVMVIDEISTAEQARVASSIRRRGVTLVATAHGHSLRDLRGNSELNTLVGGFQTVTLGDAERRDRGAVSKTVSERAGKPVFDILVEVRSVGEYVVHQDVAASVDALLAAAEAKSNVSPVIVSHRWSAADGRLFVRFEYFGGCLAAGSGRRRQRDFGANDFQWLAQLTEH